MTPAGLAPSRLRYGPPVATETSSLVAVLHGVGSCASAVAPLAARIAREVRGVTAFAPEAPDRFDCGDSGRQWFSITGVDEANRPARIAAALPALRAVLDEELLRVGLGWDRLAVVGFSQGAMMALALAADENPPAVVAAVAGRLASPVAGAAVRRPRVLILHGALDRVVPPASARRAASVLSAAGVPVEVEIAAGHGHGLSDAQATRVTRHIAATLATAPRARGR